MTRQQAVNAFRWTALAEAVSYLVLLGIAMPLKYLWQMPMAVKIIGSIHGALFVAFCLTLLLAMQKAAWSLGRAAMLFLASLLPLVPFWLDRRVKSWAEEAA
jgi:integral membrane protein